MELVWATEVLVIGGRPYPGFPILLWDTMDSCVPANEFFRHFLLRGAIGSRKSWPSTGRALYDFFSFLQAHDLDWRDVDRGEAKSVVAGYRDYCLVECQLARSTTRQRLHYVCKFYEYAQQQGWVSRLPFGYEERKVRRVAADRKCGFHAIRPPVPRSSGQAVRAQRRRFAFLVRSTRCRQFRRAPAH
jgi:hypothetical protein